LLLLILFFPHRQYYLQVSGYLIQCEIADTPQEREKGLMFRKKLGENSGMFFAYGTPSRLCFWMKNTYIPLDIAFLDERFTIVKITTMEPLTLASHCADNVRYALEVNRGWLRAHNVEEGASVTLRKKIHWGWFLRLSS